MLITSSVSLRPVAHAQSGSISGGYTLLEPLPDLTSGGGGTKDNVQFSEYVDYAFKLFIALAAFASVFMIVWGGLQYMSTDAWEGKSAGISKLKNAVLGLLLVLCSYLILQTIDPRLVSIPSTLVPPLQGLNYTPQIAGILGQVDSEINNLTVDRANLTAQANQAKQQLAALQTQEQGILDNAGMTSDEADYYCQSYPDDPMCTQLADIRDQQNTVQSTAVLKTSEATMNNFITACQGNNGADPSFWNGYSGTGGLTTAQCQAKLDAYYNSHLATLNTFGQSSDVATLNSYHTFSTAMLQINDAIATNMVSNPMGQALKGTLQNGLYVVGTAAGGVAGATAAFAGNVLINGASSANDVRLANQTITQIESITAQNLGNISDPAIKAQMIQQESNLVRSLGGTPPTH